MGIQHSNTTDLNKAKSLVELLAHSYLKPWSYKQLFVKSGGGVSSRGLFDASVPALPEFDLDEGFSF